MSVVIFFASLTYCCENTRNKHLDLPYDKMESGDLVFRKGNGLAGRAIATAEKDISYSHIGILVCIDSSWFVVHAVPNELEDKDDFERVKIEPVESFFSANKASCGELAHVNVDNSDCLLQNLTSRALSMVQDSIRFDKSYNLADSAEVYCTEFVYICYKSIGIDLTEGRRTNINTPFIKCACILPEDIYKNPRIESYYKL